MKRALAAAALAVASLTMAGCPAANETTDTDRERLRVLQAEPLLEKATKEPLAVAGFKQGDLAPRRGYVQASLLDSPSGEGAAIARRETASAADALRGNGWTVYFVGCEPPLAAGAVPPDAKRAGPVPSEEWWAFAAYAYKVVDGVSYFAAVNGNGWKSGKAAVSVNLLAPNQHESPADLFPDRPPAVGPGCLGTPELAAEPSSTGLRVMLDEDSRQSQDASGRR